MLQSVLRSVEVVSHNVRFAAGVTTNMTTTGDDAAGDPTDEARERELDEK